MRNRFRSRTRTDVIQLPDRSHERIAAAPMTDIEPSRLPMKRRLLVLLAALAVPAMAAPGDFGAEPASAPMEPATTSADLVPDTNMPFETPGMSFPGSAFFFLADPPEQALLALPSADPLDFDTVGYAIGEAIDAGPSANPFFSSAGGTSHSRALSCLAQAVYYEAASESAAGQRAVAQVVLNRVSHPNWPNSVCGVVYQGSQRATGCQFTFTCDGSLARKPGRKSFANARQIANEALSGSVYTPIGHATHYHTLWVNPYWAKSLDHVGTVGAHRFYKTRGASGRKSAFTSGYTGEEPAVTGRSAPALPDLPHIAPASGASAIADGPVASGSASNAIGTPLDTNLSTVSGPAPATDPAYSGSGQVKEPFANSGRWKSDAAKALAEREASTIPAGE
ncbi:MAG: cell wall hydrolase [Pseudomonadota bacterium]